MIHTGKGNRKRICCEPANSAFQGMRTVHLRCGGGVKDAVPIGTEPTAFAAIGHSVHT